VLPELMQTGPKKKKKKGLSIVFCVVKFLVHEQNGEQVSNSRIIRTVNMTRNIILIGGR
jgi:hypothetical protein